MALVLCRLLQNRTPALTSDDASGGTHPRDPPGTTPRCPLGDYPHIQFRFACMFGAFIAREPLLQVPPPLHPTYPPALFLFAL